MKNLWNDADAREYLARYNDPRNHLEDDVLLQAYATTLFGADSDLTMHGGGNTSVKTTVVDSMGITKRALYVKSSGTPLNTFTPKHFVVMDLDFLESLKTLDGLDDDTMASEFKAHRLSDGEMLPSIESLMHAFIPARIVSHTHPAAILKIVNRVGGAELFKKCFGDDLAVVPHARMGFNLAAAVSGAAAGVAGVVMRHHGLIVWGDDPKGVYDRTIDIVTKAEEFLARGVVRPIITVKSNSKSNSLYEDGGYPRNAPPKTDHPKSDILKPNYGGKIFHKEKFSTLTSKEISASNIDMYVVLLDTDDVMELINSSDGKSIVCDPPLAPDYPMLDRIRLRWVEGDDMPIPAADEFPVAVVNPKIGVMCYEADEAAARRTADFVRQALSIRRAIFETGGTYESLAEEFIADMQYRGYQCKKRKT